MYIIFVQGKELRKRKGKRKRKKEEKRGKDGEIKMVNECHENDYSNNNDNRMISFFYFATPIIAFFRSGIRFSSSYFLLCLRRFSSFLFSDAKSVFFILSARRISPGKGR